MRFLIARNPDPDSSLPYLLRLPLDGGLVLKARDTWPRTARVYCHGAEEAWPADAEVVEDVPVVECRRRGDSVDLLFLETRTIAREWAYRWLGAALVESMAGG